MKTKRARRKADGTGRVPDGLRARRRLVGKLELGFFVQGLGWVYCHLRLRCGFSIRELAAIAGVGVETLCQLEHGKHPPSMVTEFRVAMALGYHTDEIRRLTRRWLRKLVRRKLRR